MLSITEEKSIFAQGFKMIGAIDEAGRGPLAGPVVAACVICFNNSDWQDERLKLIKDSKRLSARQREHLIKIIYDLFPSVGIGICDHNTIDRINILGASFLAMKKAISNLSAKPDFILLDGRLTIPNLSIRQKAIVDGDNFVVSIAAASIVAKVTRDKIMADWHKHYPDYGFNHHKGYGTKFHLAQLKKIGPCPIHRKSFRPVKNLIRA